MTQEHFAIDRREFMGGVAGGVLATAASLHTQEAGAPVDSADRRPNVLFIMTDQQRADAIAALGNAQIYTPNMDRLVKRGASFTRAYSPCPVCVPARYAIRTGCMPHTTGVFQNGPVDPVASQAATMEERCGPYLARTMAQLGYRTFGVGKFHTHPVHEDVGFEVQLHSEEMYGTQEARERDAYASFIAREHPTFDFIEGLMGERTEMYYIPQMSPLPAELTVEAWAADRAVEEIRKSDSRPYFGFVSFIGPHPPLAPPIPFNRMYDPDTMPDPVRGDITVDHLDEQIPWMNYAIWADDISDSLARIIRARYYGELSYIDQCLGRILDAVESRPDADNTLICFYSDHGDHLGDHHAWQKESFFDVSCRVPFLVSWPKRIQPDQRRDELVSLIDLFGIATGAADAQDVRQGCDVLGVLSGKASERDYVVAMYGSPGSSRFKIMVREKVWKYIFMANGGREQLFNLADDPNELRQRIQDEPETAQRLRAIAIKELSVPNADRALNNGRLQTFPFEARPLQRIYQFDQSRNARGFPTHPADVLGKEA